MSDAVQPLNAADVAAAHAIYREGFDWLTTKGVRQWLVAVPLESFQARQQRAELFGFRVDHELAAVVTVAREVSAYWLPETGPVPRWWLKTLVVARKHSGAGVGGKVIQACEALVGRQGAKEVHLDCVVTGFFPRYYERAGYHELARKDITYPSGNTFHVALMRKPLPPAPA
jgi:predicted N-acetyltransferase YhbS